MEERNVPLFAHWRRAARFDNSVWVKKGMEVKMPNALKSKSPRATIREPKDQKMVLVYLNLLDILDRLTPKQKAMLRTASPVASWRKSMQGSHEYADELAAGEMLGPDIASTMLQEGYGADGVVEALRALNYEVRAKYGNEVHLRGVSDYPREHALYKPLPLPTGTTGQLPSLEELLENATGLNPTDPSTGSDSPYHALPESVAPLPVLAGTD